MDLNFFFINALNGVVYGAFLLLTSLGLSLVFGLGRVVNFAHGAFYALGGYALVVAMQRFGASGWRWQSPRCLSCCSLSPSSAVQFIQFETALKFTRCS